MANKKGDIEINQMIMIIIAIVALLVLIFLSAKWGRQTFEAMTDFIKRIFV
ncbi:MAG: hypothetical protein AABX51_04190 [Nanoarchaeota archaeon]